MLKFSDGSILGLVVVFQKDPHYKLAERFSLYKTDRMPAQYILNLLLNLNLAWWTSLLPRAHWKQSGSAPPRPQPQCKQSLWNISSQCSTDSKCLEKEVLKITRCNKICRKKGTWQDVQCYFLTFIQVENNSLRSII